MAVKPSLQVFLLVAFLIAPHVISARNLLHLHKSSRRLLFPKHLQDSRKGDKLEGIHSIKMYLQRYGYLGKNVTNSHAGDTFDGHLESAIKSYQKFFKLKASGILDKETLAQMSRPRCGVTDNFLQNNNNLGDSHYAFFPGLPKWPNSKFHLTYGFIHNFPPKFIEPVTRAFETWQASTQFSFSQAGRVQSADIMLSFERGDHGDGHPFDGPGEVLAHAFGPTDGRVHFDGDESWSLDSRFEQYDLESVALHELGHVLGLGHSGIEAAVMWPDIDSGVVKNNLHPDDIAGMEVLYP